MVSELIRHKVSFTITEDCLRLEILDLSMAFISFAESAFLLAYAKCGFPRDAAQYFSIVSVVHQSLLQMLQGIIMYKESGY